MSKTIIIVTLLLTSFSVYTLGQDSILSGPLNQNKVLPFEIEISEDDKNQVVLKCNTCAWTELSFTLESEYQTFDAIGLIHRGAASRMNDEDFPDFLISIHRNGNQFKLSSDRGTNWDSVDFLTSCSRRNYLSHQGITLR